MRTSPRRWLLAAATSLGAVWMFGSSSVPLYDAGQFPDEPYRYVAPPPHYQHTPAPTRASFTANVAGGTNPATYVNTEEIGPQASLYVPVGALHVRPGVHKVTLTVTPVAPDGESVPPDGVIVGNVYRLATTSDEGDSLQPRVSAPTPVLTLRAPTAQQPGPRLEHRAASGWQPSPRTLRVGKDLYESAVPVFGDWALVQVRRGPGASNSGMNIGLLVIGAATLAATIAVLVIRRHRVPQRD
jgi:hypothetical protein